LWLGLAALAALLLGKFLLPNRPVSLFVVIGGIAAASLLELVEHGVKLLGDVPQGLPIPGVPHLARADLNLLVPTALAAFVLAAVETSAIGRMFAAKHDYRFDANRELLAVGLGNLAAGLGRGLPVSGGMSQSLVNESAGAKSPVSGLVAALFTLFVVLFASGLLRNLPQPVLAAAKAKSDRLPNGLKRGHVVTVDPGRQTMPPKGNQPAHPVARSHQQLYTRLSVPTVKRSR
jgi:MFS superfamily sulfate permease-like transporter